MSEYLQEILNKPVNVISNDGRNFIGNLFTLKTD